MKPAVAKASGRLLSTAELDPEHIVPGIFSREGVQRAAIKSGMAR